MSGRSIVLFFAVIGWQIVNGCESSPGKITRTEVAMQKQADTTFVLSKSSPRFEQSLSSNAQYPEHKKFIRITALEIKNPGLTPISFSVYFLSGNRLVFLGKVSPYPADNPGTFIIATGGRLSAGGSLRIELELPGNHKNADSVSVRFNNLVLE